MAAQSRRNLYYVPPDEFLGTNQTAREVERLLTNIRERERVEDALREQLTERRRAEEELRRSEAHLAEGQRLSHAGSWARTFPQETSSGRRKLFASLPLILRTQSRLMQSFSKGFILTTDPLVEQTVDTAVHERTDWELAYRIVLPDLSIRHVHAVGHPVVTSTVTLSNILGRLGT